MDRVETVIDLLRARHESGSTPGRRDDDAGWPCSSRAAVHAGPTRAGWPWSSRSWACSTASTTSTVPRPARLVVLRTRRQDETPSPPTRPERQVVGRYLLRRVVELGRTAAREGLGRVMR
jgi:hypothetical protein